MGNLQYIPSFYFYKFADALSQPFSQMVAFKSGLIDSSGNIVGNESGIDPFEYFIIKLKKIFEQLPPGITKYKTGNLFGIMQLFGEAAEKLGLPKEDFNLLMEAELTVASGGNFGYYDLAEEMTTGSASGSLGVPADSQNTNKGSVAGFDPKLGDMMTRSSPVNMFGAVEMFNVPSNEYKMFKVSKNYPKSPTGNYVRRYGYRNPQSKMAVRDEESGEIHWLPAPNKKTFIEKFNLNNLSILKEQNGVVSDYTDSVLDGQENVATRKNSEEGIEVTPVEFTGQTFKDTVDILRGELEATRQSQIERIEKRMSERGQKIDAEKVQRKVTFDAPTAELQAQGRKLFRSIPDLLSASQAGKEPEIAQYHGLVRSLLPRSTSSKMPFDVAGFGFSPDRDETTIEKLDIKNPKGTSPVGLKRFQSVLDKMPRINGRAAWEEQADLVKQGRTSEAKKIQDTVINPWFNSQEIQDELAPLWTEKHAEKLRTTGTSFGVFPDPLKEIALVTPDQLANMAGRGLRYRLASSGETYYPLAQTRYGVGRLITPEGVRPPTPEEVRGLGRLTGGQVNQNFRDFIRRMLNPG